MSFIKGLSACLVVLAYSTVGQAAMLQAAAVVAMDETIYE